jgi:hypothetical protein
VLGQLAPVVPKACAGDPNAGALGAPKLGAAWDPNTGLLPNDGGLLNDGELLNADGLLKPPVLNVLAPPLPYPP